MSEKLEQVAKAIWEHGTGPGYEWENATTAEREHALGYAQTAIEAMREPTEAMIDAGDDISPIARGTESHKMGGGVVPEDYWRAMIDAVLSPPLAHGEASEVRDDR